jgi:Spy/CpxP family protein refolding chaperone
MKQISQSFRERTLSLREQLRTKRQELRQASEGGTFNEALATQKLQESAGIQAKLMGEQFRMRQEMLSVLTQEQKPNWNRSALSLRRDGPITASVKFSKLVTNMGQ